jgi:hypothetical protein
MKTDDFPIMYCNLVQITHAGIEFLVDFKRLGPESATPPEAPTVVRVVLHPVVAKSFRDALVENVAKYESTFGEIPPPPQAAPQHEQTLH